MSTSIHIDGLRGRRLFDRFPSGSSLSFVGSLESDKTNLACEIDGSRVVEGTPTFSFLSVSSG